MCGIALILSGVQIDSSCLRGADEELPSSRGGKGLRCSWTMEMLLAALQRRGPDHMGSKKIQLEQCGGLDKIRPLFYPAAADAHVEEESKNETATLLSNGISRLDCGYNIRLTHELPFAEMHFIGATLQLRGTDPVHQPLADDFGNILVYNGEIFGGIDVGSKANDSEILMLALQRCCSCSCHVSHRICCCTDKEGHTSVPQILSTIRGPWALAYWQVKSRTLWYGRDAFGRRSLLIHWPNTEDSRFIISSVAPPLGLHVPLGDVKVHSIPGENLLDASCYWEELSCGIYSVDFDIHKHTSQCNKQGVVGTVTKHGWTDALIKRLIAWNRSFVEPKNDNLCHQCYPMQRGCNISSLMLEEKPPSNVACVNDPILTQLNCYRSLTYGSELHGEADCSNKFDSDISCINQPKTVSLLNVSLSAKYLLNALKESVSRRTSKDYIFQENLFARNHLAPVAVLFSGGLDSMILAALLDQCLEPSYEIDLLNVSFDGHSAPDRVSAREGIRELQRIAPCRRWRLVEIDADLSKLDSESKHVMSLISPANTYMDLNIGIALWLAAGGDGWVNEGASGNCEKTAQRHKYKSEARILLVGSGADEQCAGYGRHKTKYRQGGWLTLQEELKLDMQRIWKRNLGRDDRCISDHGKEARFPFLDENVIRYLLDVPLWEIADLDQSTGKGDKKILREVLLLLMENSETYFWVDFIILVLLYSTFHNCLECALLFFCSWHSCYFVEVHLVS
ncbi:Asparagine synthetase domain-containing protein 1 [Nymphaea thermarum]|nr:Asparagine synthetase domain-containing protein 1 [Nymphaea thermarum]